MTIRQVNCDTKSSLKEYQIITDASRKKNGPRFVVSESGQVNLFCKLPEKSHYAAYCMGVSQVVMTKQEILELAEHLNLIPCSMCGELDFICDDCEARMKIAQGEEL